MKLGNVIILAAIAFGAYWLFSGKKDSKTPTQEETQRSALYAKLSGKTRMRLEGQLFQHTGKNNEVLVHGRIGILGDSFSEKESCALICREDPTETADGRDIDAQVWAIGTYQYTSVEGALTTVEEYLECPDVIDSQNNPASHATAATPATPLPRRAFAAHELRAVRGTVVGKNANGVIVDCMRLVSAAPATFQWVAPPGSGAGDIARMAQIAGQQQEQLRQQQKSKYGPLLILSKGVFRQAEWEPAAASGRITLAGIAAERGPVSVIAAPLGGSLYTADFTVKGNEPRPSWMSTRNDLDHR